MILQLNPSIPVNTPKGVGEAILIIDYGKEDDILWTVFLDETGQCWTFNNKEIRAIKNVSIGRENVETPKAEVPGSIMIIPNTALKADDYYFVSGTDNESEKELAIKEHEDNWTFWK